MISAEKGHGVDSLKSDIAKALPEGPWHYPEDQIADAPLRQIAAEITREKLILRLASRASLPTDSRNRKLGRRRKDGSVRIDQMIYVMRGGHKGILLGPKGATIKGVSMDSRKELSEFLDRPVHLFLQVKVRPNWLEDRERYSEMGLNFKDGD